MKLIDIQLSPIQYLLTTGQKREGVQIILTDSLGREGVGEASPLPGWSRESHQEVMTQLHERRYPLLAKTWNRNTLFEELRQFHLLPSLEFALESALLHLLEPLPEAKPLLSALLMGSKEEILRQAALRANEGFVSAKVKVSQLSLPEAREVIDQLKDIFHLRVDVNRAWDLDKALAFFSNYRLDAFDYIEEPFNDPRQLIHFTHPLAVDESYPIPLHLSDLEKIPSLETVVFKPTLQGGIASLLPLQEWAQQHQKEIVLSSAFESSLGLTHIASMAARLGIKTPCGLGTVHYLQK